MAGSEGWTTWSQEEWAISFRYPSADAAGHDVIVDRRELRPGMPRVHVMAEDRDEVYFEVVRAADLAPRAFHEAMQDRLPELYPDVSFTSLSPVGEWLCGTVRWDDQVRAVCFVEASDATYRVIYRPGSSVNREIWDSVEVS